jgi:Domain of unknown function (DUF4347)
VNRVHVWSDIPNDSSGSTSGDANEHAEEQGDIVINVNSIVELLALFKEWLKMEESFDLIDFHTHGGPGVICIGSDKLTVSNLYRLYTSNVDQIFKNNAQVIFNGCNVAEGHTGELFLLRFGKMMLKGGGGKVMGSTGYGVADAFLSGDVYHPLADWVSVKVAAGGGAKLFGHQHLVLDNIKARIESADERIPNLETNGSFSASEALVVKNWLNIARTYATNPTDENMFHACDHLRMVEKKIFEKERARILKGIPRNAIK